jgi:hypothetical protein
MKEIFIYSTLEAWMNDRPDTTLNGKVKNINNQLLEISDENGFTQIINLEKLFAIVY